MDGLREKPPEFGGGEITKASCHLGDTVTDSKAQEATTKVFFYFETVAKDWFPARKCAFWDRVSVHAFELFDSGEREIVLNSALSDFVEGEHQLVLDLGQVIIANEIFKVSMQAKVADDDGQVHKMMNMIVAGADGSYSGEKTDAMTAFEKKVDLEIHRSVEYLTDNFETEGNTAIAAVQFDSVFDLNASTFKKAFIDAMNLKYQMKIGRHIETLQKEIGAKQTAGYYSRGGGKSGVALEFKGLMTPGMRAFQETVDEQAMQAVSFMVKNYSHNKEGTMKRCCFDTVFDEDSNIGSFDPEFVGVMKNRYKRPIDCFLKQLQRQSGVSNVIPFNGSDRVCDAKAMRAEEFGGCLASTEEDLYNDGFCPEEGMDFISEIENGLVQIGVPDDIINKIIKGYQERPGQIAPRADADKTLTAVAISNILKHKMTMSLSLVVCRIIERLNDYEVTPAGMLNMGFDQAISYFHFPGLTGGQKEVMGEHYNKILLRLDKECTLQSPEEFVDTLLNKEMGKSENGFILINGILMKHVKAALQKQFVSKGLIASIEKDYYAKRKSHLGYGLESNETDMGNYKEYQDMVDSCEEVYLEAMSAYPLLQGVLLFQEQLEKQQGPQALNELNLLELEEKAGICLSPPSRCYLDEGYQMAFTEYSQRREQVTTEELIALAQESKAYLEVMYDGSMEGLPALPGRSVRKSLPPQMVEQTYQIGLDPKQQLKNRLAQEEAEAQRAMQVETWSMKSEARRKEIAEAREAEELRRWGQTPEGKAAAKKAAEGLLAGWDSSEPAKGASRSGKALQAKSASGSSKKKKRKQRKQKPKSTSNDAAAGNLLTPAEIERRKQEKAERRLKTQEAQAASAKKKKADKRRRRAANKRAAAEKEAYLQKVEEEKEAACLLKLKQVEEEKEAARLLKLKIEDDARRRIEGEKLMNRAKKVAEARKKRLAELRLKRSEELAREAL